MPDKDNNVSLPSCEPLRTEMEKCYGQSPLPSFFCRPQWKAFYGCERKAEDNRIKKDEKEGKSIAPSRRQWSEYQKCMDENGRGMFARLWCNEYRRAALSAFNDEERAAAKELRQNLAKLNKK